MDFFKNKKQTNLHFGSLSQIGLALILLISFSTAAFAQPASPMQFLPDSAAKNLPHKLVLMWVSSVSAETYHLQVSDTLSFTRTSFDKAGLTDTTQFIDVLSFNKTYYWRVSAKNATGTSAYSKISSFTTWASVPKGPDPVNLGLLKTFAIIAYAAVTDVPASVVVGDVGVTPAAGAFIDLTQTEVTGTIFTVDATGPAGSVPSASMLTVAMGDLTIAFNDAAGRTLSPVGIAGNLGGQTLFPSLYKSTGTLEISAGDLTLDGNGNSDAVWIFQIASSFNMTSGRQVFLTNGAKAANVFWQVGTAATFGTTTVMKGTIMAGTQVTFATGATLEGRALAATENVTLQQSTIKLPEGSVGTAIEEENNIPNGISLSQNFPNPFNPSTSIGYGIDKASNVELEVFNMLGQRIATLVNGQKAAGWYTVNFDASALSSGTYMYRITANGNQLTKTLMLIK